MQGAYQRMLRSRYAEFRRPKPGQNRIKIVRQHPTSVERPRNRSRLETIEVGDILLYFYAMTERFVLGT